MPWTFGIFSGFVGRSLPTYMFKHSQADNKGIGILTHLPLTQNGGNTFLPPRISRESQHPKMRGFGVHKMDPITVINAVGLVGL